MPNYTHQHHLLGLLLPFSQVPSRQLHKTRRVELTKLRRPRPIPGIKVCHQLGSKNVDSVAHSLQGTISNGEAPLTRRTLQMGTA